MWAEDPVTEVRAVKIGHCLPEVQGQIDEKKLDLLSLPILWISELLHDDGKAAAWCLNLSMRRLSHAVPTLKARLHM